MLPAIRARLKRLEYFKEIVNSKRPSHEMNRLILIGSPDSDMTDRISEFLIKDGFDIIIAWLGKPIMHLVRQHPDLIMLDLIFSPI